MVTTIETTSGVTLVAVDNGRVDCTITCFCVLGLTVTGMLSLSVTTALGVLCCFISGLTSTGGVAVLGLFSGRALDASVSLGSTIIQSYPS